MEKKYTFVSQQVWFQLIAMHQIWIKQPLEPEAIQLNCSFMEFNGLDFSQIDIHKARFCGGEPCKFVDCDFTQSDLRWVNFEGCIFENCIPDGLGQ